MYMHILSLMEQHFDMCYNLALRKTCRLINLFYEDRLASANLKVGQFSILRAVFITKQTSNKELQKLLILNQTTLSRNLKPLIRDGLLTLTTDSEDKRIKIISLSKQGIKKYHRAFPLWLQAQNDLSNKIGTKESKNIINFSEMIINELAI